MKYHKIAGKMAFGGVAGFFLAMSVTGFSNREYLPAWNYGWDKSSIFIGLIGLGFLGGVRVFDFLFPAYAAKD